MWRPILYGVLMWAVTIYAFRRGGWEEKLAAAGLVVASYLTPLLLGPDRTAYHSLESAVMSVDLAYFILMVLIVLRSNKFWPMWNAAMAAITMLAHLLPYMPEGHPFLYFNAGALWSYPMWIVIAFGVRRHRLEKVAVLG